MDEHRQLAAIMFTDIVGFTALMAENESQALFLLKKFRKTLKRAINRSDGEWLETAGDGVLASFGSAIDAVNCALLVRRHLADEARLSVRIGIHLGDVIYAHGHVFGDGVNIASRIEELAGPGDISISEQVHDAVRNKQGISTVFLGRKQLKNVDHPVDVYLLSGEEIETPDLSELDEHDQRRVSSRWAITLAAIAIAAVAVVAVISYPQQESARVPRHSVAVLPFDNLSDDASNKYFSDGLSEELLYTLTQVKGLQVASRTSSFHFKKNRDGNIQEISRTLQVANLLSGSVRKQGDRVRVIAELVNGSTGLQLWSQTYDRRVADIFLIQQDIAREIAGSLWVVLEPEAEARIARAPTQSIEAYDIYLQGKALLRGPRSANALLQAEHYFRDALGIDPSFARAQAGVCETYLLLHELTSTPRYVDDAETACNLALDMESDLEEVNIALANLFRMTGRFDQARGRLEPLINQARPNPEALVAMGQVESSLNNPTAAEALFDRAMKLQPSLGAAYMAQGELLSDFGRYAESAQMFKRLAVIWPKNALVLNRLGGSYSLSGDFESAIVVFKESLKLEATGEGYSSLGAMHYYLGDFQSAAVALEKAVIASPDVYWIWGNLGSAYRYTNVGKDLVRSTYERALELALRALDVNPNDKNALADLSLYYMNLGMEPKARQAIDRATQLAPDDPYMYYYRSLIEVSLDRNDQALDEIAAAVVRGYPKELVKADPEFKVLHDLERYRAILDLSGDDEL
ncbi:MAG: adenylate/guanylate cyclase domain-containing protein [Steroidobacteraceae bacterium]